MIDIDIVFFAGGIWPSLLQHGKGTNYVNSPFPLSFAIVLCLPFPFWQLIIGTRAKSKKKFRVARGGGGGPEWGALVRVARGGHHVDSDRSGIK